MKEVADSYGPMKDLARRVMWWLIAVLISVALVGCVLYYAQDKIVFHPSRYDGIEMVAQGLSRLSFETADGAQAAYFQPASGMHDGAPQRLWLMFCGNASLTLDLRFLAEPPPGAQKEASHTAFLFVEYPGYGECEGKPSREGIHRNVEGAVVALAEYLDVDAELLWERAGSFGHSLGAAVALESAARHGIEDAIAVSPFKSIEAMAARTTGAPVSGWIRNNFDNAAALATIAELPGAKVHIFHGSEDRIIPVEMGRELARAHPDVVDYRELEDTEHNDILGKIADELRRLLFQ